MKRIVVFAALVICLSSAAIAQSEHQPARAHHKNTPTHKATKATEAAGKPRQGASTHTPITHTPIAPSAAKSGSVDNQLRKLERETDKTTAPNSGPKPAHLPATRGSENSGDSSARKKALNFPNHPQKSSKTGRPGSKVGSNTGRRGNGTSR